LIKEKDRHINNLLILKSAFSIIDDMFVKEMENAEKMKKMKIRTWFFCGFGIKEKITDPRKISQFIEDVMDPYGRQDKYFEELNSRQKKLAMKKEDDIKDLLKLFKNNKKVVEYLYEKIENGEIYKDLKHFNDEYPVTEENRFFYKNFLPKIGNVVKLAGYNNNSNIKINIDDTINDDKRSRRSDSSNSLMDFDVVCDDNDNNV
jgi:hypothetical protein